MQGLTQLSNTPMLLSILLLAKTSLKLFVPGEGGGWTGRDQHWACDPRQMLHQRSCNQTCFLRFSLKYAHASTFHEAKNPVLWHPWRKTIGVLAYCTCLNIGRNKTLHCVLVLSVNYVAHWPTVQTLETVPKLLFFCYVHWLFLQHPSVFDERIQIILEVYGTSHQFSALQFQGGGVLVVGWFSVYKWFREVRWWRSPYTHTIEQLNTYNLVKTQFHRTFPR